jgi:hypothetical protein
MKEENKSIPRYVVKIRGAMGVIRDTHHKCYSDKNTSLCISSLPDVVECRIVRGCNLLLSPDNINYLNSECKRLNNKFNEDMGIKKEIREVLLDNANDWNKEEVRTISEIRVDSFLDDLLTKYTLTPKIDIDFIFATVNTVDNKIASTHLTEKEAEDCVKTSYDVFSLRVVKLDVKISE